MPYLVIELLLALPLACAVITTIRRNQRGHLNQWLAQGVPLGCTLLCALLLFGASSNNWLWALVAAFLLSIAGDMFLAYRTKDIHYVAGISFFLLAHVGYLVYAVTRVPFSWLRFGIIAALGLVFYFAILLPYSSLKTRPAMAVAVVVYMMISCASLAASIDPASSIARWVFAAGIAALAASDILIALRDFRGVAAVKAWVMPLYYLCHLLVITSVVIECSVH